MAEVRAYFVDGPLVGRMYTVPSPPPPQLHALAEPLPVTWVEPGEGPSPHRPVETVTYERDWMRDGVVYYRLVRPPAPKARCHLCGRRGLREVHAGPVLYGTFTELCGRCRALLEERYRNAPTAPELLTP